LVAGTSFILPVVLIVLFSFTKTADASDIVVTSLGKQMTTELHARPLGIPKANPIVTKGTSVLESFTLNSCL